MNIRYFILLFCLITNLSVAQHNNMTKQKVKEITSLGKQSIIQLALKQLDKEIDTSYFKSIKVMASDNDVYVSFDNPIKFVPENSVHYFNAVVFINGVVSRGPFKNPEDVEHDPAQVKYLKYDNEVLEKIKFVIKAISKQDVVDTIDWKYYEDDSGMIIYDKGDHYYVVVSYGRYSEGAYSINKSTGFAIEEYIASLEPDPSENEIKYVEIKN